MLPTGGIRKTQRPSKLRTLTTEKGPRHRPKPSLLSTVKANNRALAAALDDKKQLCSKLKDEILCHRREKQELCETVSNLKLQLQSQHLDIRSLQTVVDHLTTAQRSIAQANTCLTSRLASHVPISLSPISTRGGGSRGDANSKVVACPMEVDGVQFLSPPRNTSSPSGPLGLNSCTGQEGHTSLLSGSAGQPSHISLPDLDGYTSSPAGLTGQAGCTSVPDLSTQQGMSSAAYGTELLCGITNEREEGRSALERREELILDLHVEEGGEEGMNLSSMLTQRPKRKCAPLSSSMVEPSLRDKLRRGDPFTTSFTTWSPCDHRKSKKRYSAKRVALANITNKVTD